MLDKLEVGVLSTRDQDKLLRRLPRLAIDRIECQLDVVTDDAAGYSGGVDVNRTDLCLGGQVAHNNGPCPCDDDVVLGVDEDERAGVVDGCDGGAWALAGNGDILAFAGIANEAFLAPLAGDAVIVTVGVVVIALTGTRVLLACAMTTALAFSQAVGAVVRSGASHAAGCGVGPVTANVVINASALTGGLVAFAVLQEVWSAGAFGRRAKDGTVGLEVVRVTRAETGGQGMIGSAVAMARTDGAVSAGSWTCLGTADAGPAHVADACGAIGVAVDASCKALGAVIAALTGFTIGSRPEAVGAVREARALGGSVATGSSSTASSCSRSEAWANSSTIVVDVALIAGAATIGNTCSVTIAFVGAPTRALDGAAVSAVAGIALARAGGLLTSAMVSADPAAWALL